MSQIRRSCIYCVLSLLQSKRGQTCCPGCKKSFNNRCKPEKCDQCNCYLGGDFVPSEKKQKLNAPKSVLLFSRDDCSFHSVKTHSKDSRCLVIVDSFRNVKQCLAQKCKEVRAAHVNSGNAEMFSCEHTTLCDKAVPTMKVYSLTDGLINSYTCDQATKAALNHLKQSNTGPAVFQVSSVSFCVNGVATASNSVGFWRSKTQIPSLCVPLQTARFASKTKAAKHKKICMHLHMLLCILQSSGEPVTASGSPNETATFSSPPAASSGSSNETVTFSSPSAASSGSSNETVTFSNPSAASSGSSNETLIFSSPSAASSGSSNEIVTFSSPSGSSGSSNEIVTFSSPSASSSSSSNEIVTFSSPYAASSGSSNETAFTTTSQDLEVAGLQATLQLKMQLSFPYDIPSQ